MMGGKLMEAGEITPLIEAKRLIDKIRAAKIEPDELVRRWDRLVARVANEGDLKTAAVMVEYAEDKISSRPFLQTRVTSRARSIAREIENQARKETPKSGKQSGMERRQIIAGVGAGGIALAATLANVILTKHREKRLSD